MTKILVGLISLVFFYALIRFIDFIRDLFFGERWEDLSDEEKELSLEIGYAPLHIEIREFFIKIWECIREMMS